MCLSNKTLFDGKDISSIYYIRYNYMFRRLTMAIFGMYIKYLVSSYTRLIWAVYSGEVGVEVGTRYRMCHREWVGWVRGDSDKICRETQNTHFMINNVYPKAVTIMRQCKMFWQRQTGPQMAI